MDCSIHFTGRLQEKVAVDYDLFDALIYSSIALSIASLVILVVNIKDLRSHWPAFIFLLTGFPLTLDFVFGMIAEAEYNSTAHNA